MRSAIITLARIAAAVAVVASAVVSLYAAIDAAAVYTDLNVFVAGLATVVIGVALGPLFCFFAAYGLVYDLDLPAWEAAMIVGPTLIAWSVAAGRSLLRLASR